jgi:peptidyl-prolyl cis-trans isomerase A (cyclophilin A)
MRNLYLFLCLLGLMSQPALADENLLVDIQTNYGTITVQLAPDKAPLSVANFLAYVNEGFYEQTLFHRVIAGFMIQGGGLTKDLKLKPTRAPIKLESNNGLSNLRGTIAMARTSAADTATSQFFINSVDNAFLDYQDASSPGYAVFGKVVEGLNIVDGINRVATSQVKATQDMPLQPVIIEAARVREAQLSFVGLQPTYLAGETLAIALQENTINRKRALDLWVAVLMPNRELLFISPENTVSFSTQAKPFKRNVSLTETQYAVINLVVPKGIAGQYTLYAIFNEPNGNVDDLTHSLRSNLASATLTLP